MDELKHRGEAARLIPLDSQTAVKTSIIDCISLASTDGVKHIEMTILPLGEGRVRVCGILWRRKQIRCCMMLLNIETTQIAIATAK